MKIVNHKKLSKMRTWMASNFGRQEGDTFYNYILRSMSARNIVP